MSAHPECDDASKLENREKSLLMRQYVKGAARSVAVAVVAIVATVAAALGATITAAVNLAAIALIVPGTGTPNPAVPPQGTNYMQNAVAYYIAPKAPSCAVFCTPEPVPYIAQFWPFPFPGWGGLSGAKWNVSVASGVQSLNDQIGAVDPADDIVIFGYSQGATVSSIVKRQLAQDNGGVIPDRYSFVLIGNPNRPNGGLFERLAALGTVPILDATFGQPTPTDTTVLPAVNTTDIAFQYDGVADFPKYPINLLADLNAVAGFWYIHGTYLAPKGSDPATATPYGYTVPELEQAIDCSHSPKNCQTYNDTLYITIPAKTLPIMQPLLDFGAATGTTALIKPLVSLISPVTRVLIETGYDRSNYGAPSPFGLIPAINPITLTADLASAVGQGIHDALGDLGGSPTPSAPSAPSSPAVTLAAATATRNGQAAAKPTATDPAEPKASQIRGSIAASAKPVRPQSHSPANASVTDTVTDPKNAIGSLEPKPAGAAPSTERSTTTAASGRGGAGATAAAA